MYIWSTGELLILKDEEDSQKPSQLFLQTVYLSYFQLRIWGPDSAFLCFTYMLRLQKSLQSHKRLVI